MIDFEGELTTPDGEWIIKVRGGKADLVHSDIHGNEELIDTYDTVDLAIDAYESRT